MSRYRFFLACICLLLTYGFWLIPETKELLAGIALFLFGMLSLEKGFKVFTGGLLEKLLKKTTDKLWKSLSFGVISTTIMQSSSLVSVITISFLSAGLLQLYQGIGIVFGANLGTTTGAWLVAAFGLKVKISAYAMPLLVFGILLQFQKSKSLKGIGYVLAGVGFLFLGIHYMKQGFESFQHLLNLENFQAQGMLGVLLFALFGIISTVVMQSSHATLVLTITALATGQITYLSALGLAIGANVGTTVTAVIGAMSANVEGKRLAGAHLIFNLTTGSVALLAIGPLAAFVDWSAHYLGISSNDYTLKLSLFHTYFNLLGIAIMLPFIRPLERLLCRILPSNERRKHFALPPNKKDLRDVSASPQYLNPAAMQHADTALQVLIKESQHLFDNAYGVIAHGLSFHRHQLASSLPLEEVSAQAMEQGSDVEALYQRYLKPLYAAIFEFSAHARDDMDPQQQQETFAILAASRRTVGAVKHVKTLQKILQKHTAEHCSHAQYQAYQHIRLHLAGQLRGIHQLRQVSDELGSEIQLAELRLTSTQFEQQFNRQLGTQIVQRSLPAAVASSLLNDCHYAVKVSYNLLDVVEVLMTANTRGEGVAQRQQALTDSELKELAEEQA